VPHALESLRQDEKERIQQQMHVINSLIDNDRIEQHDLEEPGREALRLLKHILAPSDSPPQPSDRPVKPQLPPGYPTGPGGSGPGQ
jgi:hypothetical protein